MGSGTLKELYHNSISSFGESTASSMFGGESLTYSEFDLRVKQVREYLLEAGLSGGDKVAILSSNMPAWAICCFAAVTSGMVAVPILPDFSPQELERLIGHSEAKALCVSDRLYSKVSPECAAGLNIIIRTKNLKVVSRKRDAERGTAAEPRPEDQAMIIYTSGTTSRPKGVVLSHSALCAQLGMLTNVFPVEPWDVFLSILPLSHAFECSIGMLYPFKHGAHVVYLDKPPTASVLLPALADIRPTAMLSVPLVMVKIFRTQVLGRFSRGIAGIFYRMAPVRRVIHRLAGKRLAKSFGGRMRFFGIGGAKLDFDTERFLYEARFPYAIGYGLTETAPLLAAAVPDNVRLGSTGYVLPEVEYRLDNIKPETGEGELVVRTPSVMDGYFRNPEATAVAFTPDGWFRTNDLCTVDSEGYLRIMGRMNNMIVGPSGENIYPEEIEGVINTFNFVMDSLVREDHKGRLVAMVQFDREALEKRYKALKTEWGYKMEELKGELISYVNSKVSRFSRISVVEEQKDGFEKTPTLKIKRFLYTDNPK